MFRTRGGPAPLIRYLTAVVARTPATLGTPSAMINFASVIEIRLVDLWIKIRLVDSLVKINNIWLRFCKCLDKIWSLFGVLNFSLPKVWRTQQRFGEGSVNVWIKFG